MSMIKSITLLGSSSGRNAGDAALMSGIMDSIDQACGRNILYEIPTIKPEFIRKSYTNRTKPVSIMPWNLSIKILGLPTYQSILRTDLSLVFDAVLFDRSLYNPLFNFLSSFYLYFPPAKRKGKRFGFFNVTAGPVRTKQGQRMLRELSNTVDFITVRDQASYDVLMDIGVTNPNILVTADAALNAPMSPPERVSQILKQLGLSPDKEIFAININAYIDTWADKTRESLGKEKFLSIMAKALNKVLGEIDAQVLFVSTQHLDEPITKELMGLAGSGNKTALLSNTQYSHYDVKGVLGKSSLLFGMRVHAMILCSSALTPIIGLSYLPKVDHYYRSLGIPERTISFDEFSEESLVRHIRLGWEARAQLKKLLQSRIPVLQADAKKAAQLVAAIAQGKDITRAIREMSQEPKLAVG